MGCNYFQVGVLAQTSTSKQLKQKVCHFLLLFLFGLDDGALGPVGASRKDETRKSYKWTPEESLSEDLHKV